MNCPKCPRQHLREKYVSEMNLTVNYCPKCQGIWFAGGELEQAMPVADPHLRIARDAVRLKAPCPRCAKPLYAFPYPQTRVTIEMCKACKGLWLDAGEFKQIREARRQLPSSEEAAQDEDVGGVKGALIRFIDAAIAELLY
jgi:Zn-finger nucleic acid-binding protein